MADEVVEVLLAGDPEFLQELSATTGLTAEEIAADPLAFIPIDRMNSVFNSWTTQIAAAGEFPDVVIDPAIGAWDPVTRLYTPAGG